MDDLARRIDGYLRALTAYPDRNVGGPGNQAATALFAQECARFGFDVSVTPFDCVEWDFGSAEIVVGGERFPLKVGPYSLACDLEGPLVSVSTVEELEAIDVPGAVLLLHGDIASGQVMPRNYVFYNPEGHRRIHRAIDAAAPAAIVAATGTDPGLVGGQYPFPLFEDGDLDVPNAFLTDVEGERLVTRAGKTARVRIDSRRVPTTAEHVVATRPGAGGRRVVAMAHIDSRKGSPGALDNATGVASLLGMAELLAEYSGSLGVELVAINGEDNYSAAGELMWLAENEGRLAEIVLGMNVDDAGAKDEDSQVSRYALPDPVDATVTRVLAGRATMSDGPVWYQGDHMVLNQNGVPAIAVASANMAQFMAEAAHTERDTIELADPERVADVARFLADLTRALAEETA